MSSKRSYQSSLPGRESGAETSVLLRSALEGHFTGWKDRQHEKMRHFIEDTLDRGLANLHDPMVWAKGAVKFLTPEDQPPRWMSDDEALDSLYNSAEEVLSELGVTRYHLDHGYREFAKDKPFVFFRLCNDAETSLTNWRDELWHRSVEYAADAVQVMVAAASNGAADVWAKLPSGRFSNYLVKDEVIPVGLNRDEAIQEIYRIVVRVLHEEFDLPGVEIETMGTVMSGIWFKLTYHIPLPPSADRTPQRSSRKKGYMSRSSYGAPASIARSVVPSHRPQQR
ncbi:hypothetical protein DIPPA_30272 [Diplonema papillatum]|nr:hypothetical protein DIPPA_30272 [Diplonema papillatum]|eukprot:gene17116-26262_t